MRVIKSCFILCVLLMLVACGSMPESQKDETSALKSEIPLQKGDKPDDSVHKSVELPEMALNSELLYGFLLAEIAGQRGEMQTATQQYLKIAHKSRDIRIVRRAVKIAMYAKQYPEALELLSLWLELSPTSLEGQKLMISGLIRSGQYRQSIPRFQALINNMKPLKKALVEVIRALRDIEDVDMQLSMLSQVMVNQPQDNPDVLMAYVQLFVLDKDYRTALVYVDKLLALDASRLEPLLLKAELLQKTGDKKQALDVISKAVEQYPEQLNLKKAYARLLLDAGELDRAFEEFRYIEDKSGDAESTFALALLMLQKSQPQEAKHYLLKLIEGNTGIDEAAFFLGQITESENNISQAIRWYDLVKAGNYYFEAGLRAAILSAKQGNLTVALAKLDVLNGKNNAEALRRIQVRAEILREAKHYQQAWEVYSNALGEFTDHRDLLYGRAMVAEKLGNLSAVEQDLHKILEKEPDNSQTLNALGYILIEHTDRYEEAYLYIKRALELQPNDAAVLDSMGWVLRYMGKFHEALPYLQKAYTLQADSEIAAHLGEVFWLIGQQDKAEKVWRNALKLSPEEGILLQVMQRFLK